MKINIEIIKGLPVEQIEQYIDKTTYNVAVETREMAKGSNAYPYRSGNLMRSEIAIPITGSNKEYGLGSGVDYAKYVWKMRNVNWTNPSTIDQWYYGIMNKNGATILAQAGAKALREIKK